MVITSGRRVIHRCSLLWSRWWLPSERPYFFMNESGRAGWPDFRWVGLAASAIFVSSFICEAAYTILGKGLVMRAGVMKMLAISLLVGTLGNVLIDGPATIVAAKTLNPKAWLLLAALGIIC